MVLLLNRCMGAAGLWAGRPSWRGPAKWCAGVSDISMHTGRGNPGVDLTSARDSAGKGSTSPVGDGRPIFPLDTAGMVPLSPVVDGCLPCLPSVLLSGHHEEKYPRPAT